MFDDDPLIDVTTPDGRVVTLPRSVAASFPDLQPVAQPPEAPPTPALQAAPAPAAPTPPPAQVPAFVPPATPAPAPSREAPRPAAASPGVAPDQGPVTRPGADQGTQPTRPNPPERAMTNAELVKSGPAGTLAQQNSALDQEARANNDAARVDADAATREGKILAERDAKTQAILAERAQQAQRNLAELEARMQKRDQLADQIAKTRIDRSVDHPILSAIGLALSMVGTAMKTRPGDKWDDPAMSTLMQMIDRKVDAQMKDLDLKRASLTQMNQGITEQRQLGMDRLTEIDARRDAALQQAQQMTQTMAAQMRAPSALAAAQKLNAALGEKRAELRGQAAQRAQDQINTENAQSLQRAGLAQSERHFQATQAMEEKKLGVQERDRLAAIAEKALERQDKITAERAKQVAEGSLYDPRTRNPLLNPAGQKKYADADRLEAEARKTQDPELAARQRKQASDLRDSAVLNDSVVIRDPKVAEKVREKIEVAQNVTDQIGDVVAQLEQDPSTFDREKWAGIATQMGNIANVYQKTIGEKVSVRAFEQTMKHILEFNPDSLFDRAASQGRALESLKKLKGIVADDMNSELGGKGIKTDWKPVSRQEAGTRLDMGEKTAAEEGAAENGSWLARAGARIITGGAAGYDDFGFQNKAMEDAAARRGSEAGLSPNATTRLKMLATKADQVGDAERAQIVQTLAAPIASGLGEDGRQSVAWGMLQVIGSQSPELYNEVVSALPREQAELVRGMNSVGAKRTGTPPLGPSGFNPDRQAEASKQRDDRARAAAEAEYYRTHPVRPPLDQLRDTVPPPLGRNAPDR